MKNLINKTLSRRAMLRGLAAGAVLGVTTAAGGTAQAAATAKTKTNKSAAQNNTLVLSWPSLPAFEPVKKLAPEFTAQTGIAVEFDSIQYQNLRDKQILEMSKPGTGSYDVVAYVIFWKSEYASKKLLTPFLSYFNNKQLADAGYDFNDLIPAYVEAVGLYGGRKGYLGGKGSYLVGVPFGAETSVLAYRKDLFSKHNLSVPTTYDQLFAVAAKLKALEPGISPLTSRGKTGADTMHAYLLHLNPLGGRVFDDKWKFIANNSAGVKAAETLKKIHEYSPKGVATFALGDESAAFLQGEAAMYIDTYKIAAQTRNPEKSKVVDKVGYALHPKGVVSSSQTGGFALGIPANSANKEAAFKFIQWLTSKSTDKKLVLAGGDPSRTSTLNNAELQTKFPEYKVLVQQLKYANVDWRPLVPELPKINTIMGTEINEYLIDKRTAQEAMDIAATKVTELMTAAGYYK